MLEFTVDTKKWHRGVDGFGTGFNVDGSKSCAWAQFRSNVDMYGEYLEPVVYKIFDINDDPLIDDDTRKQKLVPLFEKLGIKISFA